MPRRMHLAFDLSWTHMEGRWRMPGSWVGRTFPDYKMFEEIALTAERGCIDMLFFGDGTGIPSTWRGTIEAAVKWGALWPRQDMSPWIAALSRVTKGLGFGITYSSTFMHPFYVARLMNSLDHITEGRIGFNVVTSTRRADAANYGFDELMPHEDRYARMEEFIDVCNALWESVAPDAFVWDRETGIVADPQKVHHIDHAGKYFKVKGPLNCVPSPQVKPVLIQAGGSPRGIKASAYFADHAFGGWKNLKDRITHRADYDEALRACGRNPDDVGILWDTLIIVCDGDAEAQARKDAMLKMNPPEATGAFLSHQSGWDFSTLPQRFTLKSLNDEIAATGASPVGLVHRLARELGEDAEVTREEFFTYGAEIASGYHHCVAGTPAKVADYLEEMFEASGSRGGFMIAHPPSTPRDLTSVVDLLVPELRRRGRFRHAYEGKTLRENLAAS